MLRSLLSIGSSVGTGAPRPEPKPAMLLVIQADAYDWPALLKGKCLADGRTIRVVQAGWDDIGVHAATYSASGVSVEVFSLGKVSFAT